AGAGPGRGDRPGGRGGLRTRRPPGTGRRRGHPPHRGGRQPRAGEPRHGGDRRDRRDRSRRGGGHMSSEQTGAPSTETEAPAPSPWNLPNALTVVRILLVPVFVWLILRDGGDVTASRWWAWAVFTIAIITDRIDGDLARAKGLVTDFGKVADPIADKALTGAGFITLSMIG